MRVFSLTLGVAVMILGPLGVLSASASSLHSHRHASTRALLRRASYARPVHHSVLEHVSMSPERATEIQAALIKRGYLTGDPTGTWDSASVSAMQHLQSDNGWQTKLTPDSRALIKLGLGPGSDPGVAPAADPAVTASAPALPVLDASTLN